MELIYDHTQAKLYFDKGSNIIKVVWTGIVSEAALKGCLLAGAKVANEAPNVSILFDRRKFDNLSTEARIWLKYTFLKQDGEGCVLIHKITKIAALKSFNPLGQIVASVLAKLLNSQKPNIEQKFMPNENEAINWLKVAKTIQMVAQPTATNMTQMAV